MLVSWRHSLKLAAKVQNCAWRLCLLFRGLFNKQSELLENFKMTKPALKYFRINTEHQIINGENWPCFRSIDRNDFSNHLGTILLSSYPSHKEICLFTNWIDIPMTTKQFFEMEKK